MQAPDSARFTSLITDPYAVDDMELDEELSPSSCSTDKTPLPVERGKEEILTTTSFATSKEELTSSLNTTDTISLPVEGGKENELTTASFATSREELTPSLCATGTMPHPVKRGNKEEQPTTSVATSQEELTPTGKQPLPMKTGNKEKQTTTSLTNSKKPQQKDKNKKEKKPSILPAGKIDALDCWTKEEKYYLFLGIKYKGSKKVKEIQDNIPSKTVEEIEAAIAYYKDRAHQNPECASRKLKVRRFKAKPIIPLASWAKLLTDNLNYNELQTDFVSAVRLIADLEPIPSPVCTEQIDFRKIYHQIADAMEGKTPAYNRLTTYVLNSCVLDTALISRAFIKQTTFKNIINSISFREKGIPIFPRPTQENKLAIIRHLCAQRNYNPLNILEEHLMPVTNMPIGSFHSN